METILRFLNARTFALVGIVAIGVVLADRYQEYPRVWWQERVDASHRGKSALGGAIAQDLDQRESKRLRGLYRDVSAEIAAAQAKGLDVGRLQAYADKALALDTPDYRDAAFENLNKIRLMVPQTKEQFRPAALDDEPSDGPATPASTTRGGRKAR